MENSAWIHPGVLLSAFLAIIGLAVWAIRLESKNNTNSIEIERLQKEKKELEDELYKHMMDEKRHYNEQFFNEFRNTLDSKFKQLDGQLSTINGKLDRLSSK